jgi:nucleotide-binding universal stress UspA family protein
MINKILVPTDFSVAASNSLDYAIGFAKKTNAEILVLHINQIALVDASMPAETYQMFVKEIEDFTSEQFSTIEEKLKQHSVKYTLLSKYGFVADEVCEIAESDNIDLIIMGTTGASGITEVLIGSNSASVVAKTKIPVLVIPPSIPYKDLEKIVYATDYNEPEFSSFLRLIYYAELFDCPLDVIHVKSDNDKYFNSENNFFKKHRDEISYPKLQFITLEKGDVINSINTYIDDHHADLLVMAKHNRHFFDRLFHRSLSKKMAFHTHIPLLILVKENQND